MGADDLEQWLIEEAVLMRFHEMAEEKRAEEEARMEARDTGKRALGIV